MNLKFFFFIAIVFLSTFYLSNFAFAGDARPYMCIQNHTGRALYVNISDHRYFNAIAVQDACLPTQIENTQENNTQDENNQEANAQDFTNQADATEGTWVVWTPGQMLYITPTTQCTQSLFHPNNACVAELHIALVPKEDPSFEDIPVVWKTYTSTFAAPGTPEVDWWYYLRPCYGGGACNIQLASKGLGITMYSANNQTSAQLAIGSNNFTGLFADCIGIRCDSKPEDHVIGEFDLLSASMLHRNR